MKRIILSLASLALCLCAGAQVLDGPRYGIIGGLTSSSADVKDVKSSNISQYHVGLAAQFPLGLGFAIQPALTYQVKGVALDQVPDNTVGDVVKSFETKVGYLEVPVQLQWGPDLLAFRPYVFGEPFVGYRLHASTKSEGSYKWADFNDDLKKIEYGLGLGVGIDVWKLQLSAKYFWNFGAISAEGSGKDAVSTVKSAFNDGKNFSGVACSIALLF